MYAWVCNAILFKCITMYHLYQQIQHFHSSVPKLSPGYSPVNNSRNKRLSAFLLYFSGFKTISFNIFFVKIIFHKNELFWINSILLKIKNYKQLQKNMETLLHSSVLWIFKVIRQAFLVLALGEHDNLWFLLISPVVHDHNSFNTL